MKKTLILIIMGLLFVLTACIKDDLVLDDYQRVFQEIQIEYTEGDSQNHVTNDLTFPTTTSVDDVTISWMTSHPSIIEATGFVRRPIEDTSVSIALVVTIDGASKDQVTVVTVIAGETDPYSEIEVSFDSNGGSLVEKQIIQQGSRAENPPVPTRDNYQFIGWYLDEVAFDFNQIIETNITLIAHWEASNHVTDPLIPGRQLTFQDEFEGTQIDLTKWDFQNGTGAEYGLSFWGNQEKQYYQPENIEVSNGTLKIHARQETIYSQAGAMHYTSSKIVTLNRFHQTFGRFEAKIKAPIGDGFWPAFWMMPVENNYGNGWPYNGEIDIVEMRGRIPTSISSAIHFHNGNHHQYLTRETVLPNAGRIDDFHVYAVEWTLGSLQFSVDGYVYHMQNNAWYNTPRPFDKDFYMILNLAIGGTFDGHREPSPIDFPAALEVDYVRVYAEN